MTKLLILVFNFLLGLVLIFFSSCAEKMTNANITITELRNADGQVIIQVFKCEAAYESHRPYKQFTFDKKNVANGSLHVKCMLANGNYGFIIIDDENSNGKIDKNFIGIPNEGFGFSNFFMEKMQKPTFGEIMITKKHLHKLVIRVKYI